MEVVKRLNLLWLILLLVGGISWACIALFDINVLSEIFGTGTLLDVVYVVLGIAAVLYVLPRLMDEAGHMGRTRPHGA